MGCGYGYRWVWVWVQVLNTHTHTHTHMVGIQGLIAPFSLSGNEGGSSGVLIAVVVSTVSHDP